MLKTLSPRRMPSLRPLTITAADRQKLQELLESDICLAYAASGVCSDLALKLDIACAADADAITSDVVTMNSTVVLADVRWGHLKVVRLVYPRNASGEGFVSILSPLGVALLGARVGETVQTRLADSPTCHRVEKLLCQPTNDGEHPAHQTVHHT
jgi:regulator of nucleoside diphosphate kinase